MNNSDGKYCLAMLDESAEDSNGEGDEDWTVLEVSTIAPKLVKKRNKGYYCTLKASFNSSIILETNLLTCLHCNNKLPLLFRPVFLLYILPLYILHRS